jgi:hypothetical protein
MFHKMIVSIIDIVSHIASSDDEEDGEDEDDDNTEEGMLSQNNERGRLMATIWKAEQLCIEIIQEDQMKIDSLNLPEW